MIIKKLTVKSAGFPEVLRNIPAPPRQLYVSDGSLAGLLERPRVAIVGTRKITPYGKQVTWQLAKELAERGVVIISGLALGVDALAHEAALEAGGQAIAVLPCPLTKIVPASNQYLARWIVERGGVLVSEYGPNDNTYKQNFIARNRLVSGLADALLITEASEKSGSLYTANFAVEQGKDIFVVPGNITAPGSAGAINLLKQGQAAPVTSYEDILQGLGLEDPIRSRKVRGDNPKEQAVLDAMRQGITAGERLLERSGLDVSEFNRTLTMLQLGGKIRPLGANHWAVT